jgi:hypothetical protein
MADTKTEQGYKSIEVSCQQEGLGMMMDVELMNYGEKCRNKTEWTIKIFDTVANEHIYRGNLQETIELILLGKVCKEQIEANKSKCDLCEKPATWFQSPLGNPDEPKLCNDCYHTKMELGARDYLAEAHHLLGTKRQSTAPCSS